MSVSRIILVGIGIVQSAKIPTENVGYWHEKKMFLPCTYFHVVFTLPQELNTYCLKYPADLYNILFQVSKETLFTFGNDPNHLGVQLGAISLLHTWGQNLSLHLHVHMIVPGSGFTKENHWKNSASNGDYLFPVKAKIKVYRVKFMNMFLRFLNKNKLSIPLALRRKLYNKNWVIYAKQPFKNTESVVEYLGRYSHKIAISNHRLKSIANGQISFIYKDYRHGSINKIMALDSKEFLRRFFLTYSTTKVYENPSLWIFSLTSEEEVKNRTNETRSSYLKS